MCFSDVKQHGIRWLKDTNLPGDIIFLFLQQIGKISFLGLHFAHQVIYFVSPCLPVDPDVRPKQQIGWGLRILRKPEHLIGRRDIQRRSPRIKASIQSKMEEITSYKFLIQLLKFLIQLLTVRKSIWRKNLPAHHSTTRILLQGYLR